MRALPSLILVLSACGGVAPEVEPDPGPGFEPVETTATAAVASPPPNPWDAMDSHGLRAYVRARVQEQLGEHQPDFDLDQLDAYRENPESAPELGGRAAERLIDLAVVELAEDEIDEAEKTVLLVRARAKNRNSAYTGTTLLAEVARRRAGEEPEAQADAIAATFRTLPRPRFGSATVLYQLYQSTDQLEARVEQTRTQQMLSLESASGVLFLSQVMPPIVEARPQYMAAIERVQQEHSRARPEREYRFSTYDVSRIRSPQPVVVGVWDVGTDPSQFTQQLFTNPAEQPNGQDDDGNGQIDDIHGIVGDADDPNTALLYEPAEEIVTRYAPFLRGMMDLRAGMASTEAARSVIALFGEATTPEAVEALERNLDAVGEWAHGTHVAGIVLAGNPHARLAIFRSAWAGETRTYYHRGPTDEELAAERRNAVAIAEFVNRHQVRVVNASLGFSRDYLEDQLHYESSQYPDEDAVTARADQVMAHRAETWRTVFEACPNTLFVVAAGNDNRDVVEYGEIPSSFEHENLVAVGAVDAWGNWATFTNSHEDRVPIFDRGVAVDSALPNGERVPLSGTSMAAPNVANLAAKMLVVSPELTPAQMIEIIVATGDPIAAPFNGRIANERRAVARARSRR